MLAFVVVASWGLEFAFRVRVLRSPRKLLKTLAFVIPPFVLWDWYAITRNHWNFDPAQTTGINGPFGVPLEEYLFFVIIPVAALLTYEGVCAVLRYFSALRVKSGAEA
jgi:lycopene cyclase domain-containing protein